MQFVNVIHYENVWFHAKCLSVVFGYRRIEETVELSLNKLHNLKGILSHMQFLPELLMELLQSRFLLVPSNTWIIALKETFFLSLNFNFYRIIKRLGQLVRLRSQQLISFCFNKSNMWFIENFISIKKLTWI